MNKLEEIEKEIYEHFYDENPEFEIIRPYVADDVQISISILFFANAYLYIVSTLSRLTKDKDKEISINAEKYLKRILGYIGSLTHHNHAIGKDIVNNFAYNLYKVGDEYDRVLSYAPESILQEVKHVSTWYDKPVTNTESHTEYQSLMSVIEKLVRTSKTDS